jgi:RNA polymerase sigma-70 factor (ECF subfamily)
MTIAELEGPLRDVHEESYSWTVVCCGGDRAEAEDVLQETYLRLLDGRLTFGGGSSFKTWLFAVLRRAARDRKRRVASRLKLLARWSRPGEPRPAGQERRAIASERERQVRTLLAGLAPRQRQVLELVFYHELALSEAAEVMGVSRGTVSRHYDRGKRALLSSLEEAALEL